MADLADNLPDVSPSWLTGTWGSRLLYALIKPAAEIVETARQAVRARMPGFGTPTALPAIGRDRLVLRGFAEGDDDYAERLRRWLEYHRRAGTTPNLLVQILGWASPQAVAVAHVTNESVWDRALGPLTASVTDASVALAQLRPPAATVWNWDGDALAWGRFWLILSPLTVDAGARRKIGDAGLVIGARDVAIGTRMTPGQVGGVRAVVRQWKAAHETCTAIIINLNSSVGYDKTGAAMPNGTWQYWCNPATGAAVRNAGVLYLQGVT
jgi:hypothetical protein